MRNTSRYSRRFILGLFFGAVAASTVLRNQRQEELKDPNIFPKDGTKEEQLAWIAAHQEAMRSWRPECVIDDTEGHLRDLGNVNVGFSLTGKAKDQVATRNVNSIIDNEVRGYARELSRADLTRDQREGLVSELYYKVSEALRNKANALPPASEFETEFRVAEECFYFKAESISGAIIKRSLERE